MDGRENDLNTFTRPWIRSPVLLLAIFYSLLFIFLLFIFHFLFFIFYFYLIFLCLLTFSEYDFLFYLSIVFRDIFVFCHCFSMS